MSVGFDGHCNANWMRFLLQLSYIVVLLLRKVRLVNCMPMALVHILPHLLGRLNCVKLSVRFMNSYNFVLMKLIAIFASLNFKSLMHSCMLHMHTVNYFNFNNTSFSIRVSNVAATNRN